MSGLWIVHRDARICAALARLAAAPDDALRGAPGDPRFAAAEPPGVVVLGLAAPFEAELEFAHRLAPRLRGTAWLLVAERAELATAQRLFDVLDAELLAYPPEGTALRRRLRALARRAGPEPLPLSQRVVRDALSARFTRWFGDLELPALLRALDPRLADVPLLVRGEPGSGRSSLARYVHAFGGGAGGAFAQVACTPALAVEGLRGAVAAALRDGEAGALCLVEVDRLAPAVQRDLVDWIELGLPRGLARTRRLRWMATAAEAEAAPLDAALRQALGGLVLRVPPLRERAASIPDLVAAAAARFGAARGERTRRFDEAALRVLSEHPWPGNLRELEAVVAQSLAASAADPLGPADLTYDGEAFAPAAPAAPDADLVEAVDALDELELPAAELEAPEPAAPEPAPAQPAPAPAPASADVAAPPPLQPLAAALAHELRGPLTGIRTFAELLPERWQDVEFRARFAERTAEDVRRMEASLERLARVARFGPPALEAVDVTRLLAELLEARRETIRERRLLVLQELDTQQPVARADAAQLRFALDALLGASFALVPERGDVYLASKHHAAGLHGAPSLRVLVRFHGPERGGASARVPGVTPAENSLALVLAELVVRAQGGSFTVGAGDTGETLVVLEIPA